MYRFQLSKHQSLKQGKLVNETKVAPYSKVLKISMTGATGFVGMKTLKALLESGHFVKALVRNSSRVTHISHPNLEWIDGGLGDADAVLVEGADVVLHIAGLIKAQRKDDFYKVNERDAGNLAKAADIAGVKRLILLSSMVARQPQLSHYAGSKAAGEVAVRNVYNGDLAIIRAPAVFGPEDVATRPFYALIEKGILPVPGGRHWKTRKLSMIYINDLIDAIIGPALSGAYDGKTLSPATIDHMTWLDFAQSAQVAAKRSVKSVRIPLWFLYSVGAITSVTSRLFNKGHLTLGKLNEFLYEDWSGADLLSEATPFLTALENTLRDYRASKSE